MPRFFLLKHFLPQLTIESLGGETAGVTEFRIALNSMLVACNWAVFRYEIGSCLLRRIQRVGFPVLIVLWHMKIAYAFSHVLLIFIEEEEPNGEFLPLVESLMCGLLSRSCERWRKTLASLLFWDVATYFEDNRVKETRHWTAGRHIATVNHAKEYHS